MPDNYTLKLTLQEANLVHMLVRDHLAKVTAQITNSQGKDEAGKIMYAVAEGLSRKL